MTGILEPAGVESVPDDTLSNVFQIVSGNSIGSAIISALDIGIDWISVHLVSSSGQNSLQALYPDVKNTEKHLLRAVEPFLNQAPNEESQNGTEITQKQATEERTHDQQEDAQRIAFIRHSGRALRWRRRMTADKRYSFCKPTYGTKCFAKPCKRPKVPLALYGGFQLARPTTGHGRLPPDRRKS